MRGRTISRGSSRSRRGVRVCAVEVLICRGCEPELSIDVPVESSKLTMPSSRVAVSHRGFAFISMSHSATS